MQFLDQNLPFFEEAMRGIMAFVCKFLYPLIAHLYNLFINISRVNILSESQVAPIYQRVTMLLTIIMVFYVTFQFVKYIVQPDEITDKEKGAGKIIYKMIIVVVLIAFVPKIFEGAFWVQSKIIHNDLVGKIVLGQANDNSGDFGSNFAANIFSLFYKFEPDAEREITIDEECGDLECRQVVSLNLNMLRQENTLVYLNLGLNESAEKPTSVKNAKEEVALITFDYFFAVIIGAIVAWMLVMYCIEAGTRWAQLVFLQIIAPIPIIGYLSPKKDGIFQKWVQQCMTTYLDLFIRMGILYFILLVCQILTNSLSDGTLFAGLDGLGDWMKTFIYIALVLGLMLFGKKAPKMLQELFPKKGAASGSFGLTGTAKDVASGVKKGYGAVRGVYRTGKMAVGGAAGGLAGAVMGARTGRFFSGMIKGAKAGGQKKGNVFSNIRKGVDDVREDVEKDKDRKAAGGTYMGGRFRKGHFKSQAKDQERQIADLEDMQKKKKSVNDAIGEVKFRKQMNTIGEALTASGNTKAANEWEAIKKAAEKTSRKFAAGKINAVEFQQEMQAHIDGFNNRYFQPNANGQTNPNAVHIDSSALEIGSTKWDNVKVNIDSARKTAKDLDGKEYISDDGTTQVKFTYDEDKFAEEIGDIADQAGTAISIIKDSDEYKEAQANSK